MTDSERGRDAARTIWRLGLAGSAVADSSASEYADPLTPEFASAALTELLELQRETAGIHREMLEGAQMSAEQLNVESSHGLLEVIQNADDLHAREILIATRRSRGKVELLIAHDGDRVQLPHAVAMTFAFLSTKRADPRAKGRFGIGLKTLGRLAESLTVHCEPYHFTIAGNELRPAPAAPPIAGFYDARPSSTLLRLPLREGVDGEELRRWFEELGSRSIIFLDSVRSLKLVELDTGTVVAHHELMEAQTRTIVLSGIDEPCSRTRLRDPRAGQAWDRYEMFRRVPADLARRHKATANTTPIGVAVSARSDEGGRLYAGLPLGLVTRLPLSVNAQFDVDVARRGIQHERWNEWLLTQCGHLAAGVALDRLVNEPSHAWRAIPLAVEHELNDDPWVADRLAAFIDAVHKRVRARFQLDVDGVVRVLGDLAYESPPLAGLIGQAEVTGLRPGRFLVPPRSRDREGRWRRVLADLGRAELIDVDDALALLDWEDADLGTRDVDWFLKMARAAIEADLGYALSSRKSIITIDNRRIVPRSPGQAGEILLRAAEVDSLATRLQLANAINPAYLVNSPAATVVRTWLEEEELLRDVADAESTLRAIAARSEDDGPLTVGDQELLLLRNLLSSVEPALQQELGRRIGSAIALKVQRWEAKKRATATDRPANAYLPPSIDDHTDGWMKAADKTPGINRIHPQYDELLRQPGRGRRESPERRPMSARAFFLLLGAEVSPRLLGPQRLESARNGDPASVIDQAVVSPTQREELTGLPRHATHLRHDYDSPDLMLVLQDLRRERGIRARRERVRALLSTLSREWERLYANHMSATAVFSRYGVWHPAGVITASWLARAMDEAWLTNEDGEWRAPRDLAVRTPATEAIFGDDRASFADGLSDADAASPTVRALGIQTDPAVSEMVEQLGGLRDRGGVVDEHAIAARYAAIANACPKRDLSATDIIGDLSVRQLRNRFGTRQTNRGLIYVNGNWLGPPNVFVGAPIFGRRRAFVSERSSAERLWKVLAMGLPDLNDCMDVLGEIVAEAEHPPEEVLANTYRYMEHRIANSSPAVRARLGRLPLWTGAAWCLERPVYVVEDPAVSRALSNHLRIWQLPVASALIPELTRAVGGTLLKTDAFAPMVHEQAFSGHAAIEEQFRASVDLLRDWLTRRDAGLSDARDVAWEELSAAHLVIDPDLEIELQGPVRVPIQVAVKAHLTRTPLTFYFADEQSAGDDDLGGRMIATLFKGDRDKLALVWSRSWQKAAHGVRGTISLAEDRGDLAAITALHDQATAATTIARRAKTTSRSEGSETKQSSHGQSAVFPVRRLKDIESLGGKMASLDGVGGRGDGGSGTSSRGRRGLRGSLPQGKRIDGSRSAPQRGPLAYSPDEKETLALQVLQLAINGDAAELRDYRHLRGVGADALDKLRRYFEIKSSYGALPDEVTLSANEAERASREGNKFFLAVIAGLEEGYETVVKIFTNPLRLLEFKDNSSVTLKGITGRSANALEVRFPKAAALPVAAEESVSETDGHLSGISAE